MASPFCEVPTAHRPEESERAGESKLPIGLSGVDGEGQGLPEVVLLLLDARDPASLIGPGQVRLGLFGEEEKVLAVSVHGGLSLLPIGGQRLGGVLPDRLQQLQACLSIRRRLCVDEARVEQGLGEGERVPELIAGVADRLGRLERAAATEDGHAVEEGSLGNRQQRVAPGDRRTHRPLALGQIARASGK